MRNLGKLAALGTAIASVAFATALLRAQTPAGNQHRIAWNQPEAPAVASTFQWAIFVDGTRAPLSGVTCVAGTPANSSTCSVPFPAMTPGQHSIELIAIQTVDGQAFESARSAPLVVRFVVVSTPTSLRVIAPGPPTP